jgi:hypothetical protein
MQPATPPTRATTQPRRVWSRPRFECLESRPEVTAYAGAGDSDGGVWWFANR